jgi:glutamyl-tRNA synthetase
VVQGPVTPVRDDPDFLARAAALLPETLDWAAWTNAVKQETGVKGKGLFMPLRHALTGMEHGPDMASLLPLIGRERALKLLAGETA